MRFHIPSYVLGFATGAILGGGREILRPVAVEIGALALQVARAGRAIIERQREHAEDLRADIEERLRARLRRSRNNGNGAVANARA